MKGRWREEPLSARYPKVAGACQFLSPLGRRYIYTYVCVREYSREPMNMAPPNAASSRDIQACTGFGQHTPNIGRGAMEDSVTRHTLIIRYTKTMPQHVRQNRDDLDRQLV